VTRTFSQARFINHANQTQTEKNKENQLELKMVRQAEKEQKEELLQVCYNKKWAPRKETIKNFFL
jgi:hypothetical protein